MVEDEREFKLDFNQYHFDKWVKSKVEQIPSGSRVIDIGAGTSPYRNLFKECEYITQDFLRYDGVKLGGTYSYGDIDIVSDITEIPERDSSFDVVLCTGVLEHVLEPIKALEEMSRILKSGGRMLLTAPFSCGSHQEPYIFYSGFHPNWFRHFMPEFGLEIVEISPNGGFFKFVAQESGRVSTLLANNLEAFSAYDVDSLIELFKTTIQKYLFEFEKKLFSEILTVGYCIEGFKR